MKWIDFINNHTSEELEKFSSDEIAQRHHEGWIEEAILSATELNNIIDYDFNHSEREDVSITAVKQDVLKEIVKEVAEKFYKELYDSKCSIDYFHAFNSDVCESDVLNKIYKTIEDYYLPKSE